MVSSDKLGFILFVSLIAIFFLIPDPEVLQKPFRVGLSLFFFIVFISLIIYQNIRIRTLVPVIISTVLLGTTLLRGTFQTSYINAWLCLIGLLLLPKLVFKISEKRLFDLNLLHFMCMVSIILQFLYFSSADGRPSLGYEINLSGAYLFLFFLFSDLLRRKDGKILVGFLSVLILSRLLIFSIIIFYFVRFIKPFFPNKIRLLRFWVIALTSYLLISVFSIWYVATIKSRISYDTSFSRLTTLNDGSNQWRFLTNTLVMAKIYQNPQDPKVLLGYGPVENFIKGTKGALMMPHNELFDSIVQFGLITVIFFAFISFPIFNNYTNFSNIEFVVPLVFFTLILWVRYLIVPSFEMLFILFMLNAVSQKSGLVESNLLLDANCLPSK